MRAVLHVLVTVHHLICISPVGYCAVCAGHADTGV